MRSFLVFMLLASGVSTSCSSDSYLVLTVEAPPAIHDVAKLEVTRYGEDPPRVQMLPVLNFKFPITFSISGLGNEGSADLEISAISTEDFVVGQSRSQVPLADSEATVRLDTMDFVVNSDFEDDQFLTDAADSVGRQVAATALGDWTVAFGATCAACELYGRRFNSAGVPSSTGDSEGPVAFRITTEPSRRGSASPAIASAGLKMVVVWDFAHIDDGSSGVACRGIDERGSETPAQIPVTFETAKGVDAAPLPDGNFVVTWLAQLGQASEVHMRFVRPDCTSLTATPTSISKPERDTPRGTHVASNGNALLYAWILGDSVRYRAGTASGELLEERSIDPPAGSIVEQVRITAMDSGFGIALRLAATDRTKPGSIVLYRANATGELMPAPPTVITDQSGSNTSTGRIGFGIATRGDGATMVVWHQCSDGSSTACLNRLDVYGRLLRSDGTPVGEPFIIPTTTEGNQRNPSVTAIDGAFAVTWTDESMSAPDTSGYAVRARLIYPSF